jgi:hypothetical protein
MRALIIILLLATAAAAYEAGDKTANYAKLTGNDPIRAAANVYVDALGGWFWLILAMGPYAALVIAQRNLHIATMWLTVVLAGYGSLIFGFSGSQVTAAIPSHIFYPLVVVWVMSVLLRLLSPKYTN